MPLFITPNEAVARVERSAIFVTDEEDDWQPSAEDIAKAEADEAAEAAYEARIAAEAAQKRAEADAWVREWDQGLDPVFARISRLRSRY